MTKKVWYAPNRMEAYDQKEIDAVVACLNDGWLSPGPRTAEFEKKLSERFGKKYGLFVNSGSSANMLAVICAGIGPGVEVVTPACTFSTTVAPLVQNGAKVKFCDISPQRYVPSVEQVIAEVTPNTKVIMIPNLLGNKIDWAALKAQLVKMGRSDIILIEDSCDTITHTPETDIATCSFYSSHIITAGGTGGIVMFNNLDWYNRALRIRDWGRAGNNDESIAERFNHGLLGDVQYDWKFLYVEFGYNFKACEMNAAFGLTQLEKLPKFEEIRHNHINRYLKNLREDEYASKYYKLPDIKPEILLLAFPLECPHRMEALTYLEDNQIQTRVTMAGNILRHPAYLNVFPEESKRSFPESDIVMKNGFLVGCHHGLTDEDVDRVCKVLSDFAKAHLQK